MNDDKLKKKVHGIVDRADKGWATIIVWAFLILMLIGVVILLMEIK